MRPCPSATRRHTPSASSEAWMLSTFPVLLFLKMTPCRLSRSRPSFCGRTGHEGTQSHGTVEQPQLRWVQPSKHPHHRPATASSSTPIHTPTQEAPLGPSPCPLTYHGPLHLLVDLVELQRIGHGGCGVWEGTGRSSGRFSSPPSPACPGQRQRSQSRHLWEDSE